MKIDSIIALVTSPEPESGCCTVEGMACAGIAPKPQLALRREVCGLEGSGLE